ncbi:MAG: NAD(P)/FAD-dependent oxidoreductase [Opitutales bacterium]|nr:NAD(P)/FAD-dependent oxidoreductase [Opitutales bacterium]
MPANTAKEIRADVLIIGAGMSGLAAGIRLAHFGKKVLLVDRHYSVGGLNGFYTIDGRGYDVGLHAMTNYVPAGTKNAPLTKLLRQLRIRYDELDLCPQRESAIHAFGNKLRFSNDFSLLESEIARAFPQEIDGFRKLDEFLKNFDETALDAKDGSARACVGNFLRSRELTDSLFIPLSFYGSSLPDDMALPQFAIMWRSIFREGFARPHIGVRQILRLLNKKFSEAGGIRKLRCGVKKIYVENARAVAAELDDGSRVYADKILSSAGSTETMRLCSHVPADFGAENIGQLGFCETISVLDASPEKDFGWNETIIFFNDAEKFNYRTPPGLIDPRSGVICIPNNYTWRDPARAPREGCLRVTCLANYTQWKDLRKHGEEAYAQAKALAYEKLLDVALTHLAPVSEEKIRAKLLAKDMFTPLTVERFSGKLGGAIYGATRKNRTGTTDVENLFLCGTDQGFLGITGAMLSGISMANLHGLS